MFLLPQDVETLETLNLISTQNNRLRLVNMQQHNSTLPALKYISDESFGYPASVQSKRGSSRKSKEKETVQLFTDSMVMISSSDTLNGHSYSAHRDSGSSTDFSVSMLPSMTNAFSYYDSPTSEGNSFDTNDFLNNDQTHSDFLDEESEHVVGVVTRFLTQINKDISGYEQAKSPKSFNETEQISYNHKHSGLLVPHKPSRSGFHTRKIKSCPEAANLSTSFETAEYPLMRKSAPLFCKGKLTKLQRDFNKNVCDSASSEEVVTTDSAADSLQTEVQTMLFLGTDFGHSCDRPSRSRGSTKSCTSTCDSTDTQILADLMRCTAKSDCTVHAQPWVPGDAQEAPSSEQRKHKLCRSCSLDGLKFHPACPLRKAVSDSCSELRVLK